MASVRCACVNKLMSILEYYWAVNVVTTLSVSVNVILCRSRKLSPASSRLGLTSSVPCSCLCLRCHIDKTSAWNKAQTLELFTAHIKHFLYAHNIFSKTQFFSPVHQRVIQPATFDTDHIFSESSLPHTHVGTTGNVWKCDKETDLSWRRRWDLCCVIDVCVELSWGADWAGPTGSTVCTRAANEGSPIFHKHREGLLCTYHG